MISLAEIRAAVAARFDWGVRALQRLVSIDSPAPHESACQQALFQLLVEQGLQAELHPLDNGGLRRLDGFYDAGLPLENRPNLVARYGLGHPGAPTLIINAHIDTEVWVEQLESWSVHPLSGAVRDGWLYGRGAVDDKGQVMAAAMALLALKDLGYQPPGLVLLESVVGEEPSGNGTLALCAQGFLADAAVNLEPTGSQVHFGHRGILGYRFRGHGQAVHGGMAGETPNILCELAQLAGAIDDSFTRWSHPQDVDYGPPSFNLGTLSGGTTIFTRPGQSVMECAVRYAPGTYAEVTNWVAAVIQAHLATRSLPPDAITWQLYLHHDASGLAPGHPLVQALHASLREVAPDCKLGSFPGGTDARHLNNRYGVPTAIFGPGDLALAHSPDESLDLEEWRHAIEGLALFTYRWCGPADTEV